MLNIPNLKRLFVRVIYYSKQWNIFTHVIALIRLFVMIYPIIQQNIIGINATVTFEYLET